MTMQLAVLGILVVLAARLPVWIPATIALLVFAMMVLTADSQYGIIPRMDALRVQMGSVDETPAGNPLRVREAIRFLMGAGLLKVRGGRPLLD